MANKANISFLEKLPYSDERFLNLFNEVYTLRVIHHYKASRTGDYFENRYHNSSFDFKRFLEDTVWVSQVNLTSVSFDDERDLQYHKDLLNPAIRQDLSYLSSEIYPLTIDQKIDQGQPFIRSVSVEMLCLKDMPSSLHQFNAWANVQMIKTELFLKDMIHRINLGFCSHLTLKINCYMSLELLNYIRLIHNKLGLSYCARWNDDLRCMILVFGVKPKKSLGSTLFKCALECLYAHQNKVHTVISFHKNTFKFSVRFKEGKNLIHITDSGSGDSVMGYLPTFI
jgi:hypothetical protein